MKPPQWPLLWILLATFHYTLSWTLTETPPLLRDKLNSLPSTESLPPGKPHGFLIVDERIVPPVDNLESLFDLKDIERLELQPHNVTVPVALCAIDPVQYPSFSRARKACRKGNILLKRHNQSFVGRVGDRVLVGDILCHQLRMGDGTFSAAKYSPPPFEVPVVVQDDHFALVNKPAGVVTLGAGMTMRRALPFCLEPPQSGVWQALRRPASVHRLDKPTSGILVIAKTKPVLSHLSKQFHDRIVRKTYTAIVNGIPQEDDCLRINAQQAYDMGVDVDPMEDTKWNLIDYNLDDRQAVTIWRALRYVPSLYAHDNTLTLVELKPKTGRYHQLRRHMAWVCKRPLVGDAEYDKNTESAQKFRDRGLFLCSNKVMLQHPYYNTEMGRQVLEDMDEESKQEILKQFPMVNSVVMVHGEIELPDKFENLLANEKQRHEKFS